LFFQTYHVSILATVVFKKLRDALQLEEPDIDCLWFSYHNWQR
jgi:hypothetical protein